MQAGMAEQISLFGPHLVEESPQKGDGSRRAGRIDPTRLPTPKKAGPVGVRFGTSSWTYPGWSGSVYRDVSAYGSTQRFSDLCLVEYAKDPRFRCAGADSFYYMPPAARVPLLARYREQLDSVGDRVELCPKAWHGVTVHRYSPQQCAQWRLPHEQNPGFLDPGLFLEQVALPLAAGLGPHLGPIILEFQENGLLPSEFAERLESFLVSVRRRFDGKLCVELRTAEHLSGQYLDVLHELSVVHALNAWTQMPDVGWQFEQVRKRHGLHWPFWLVRALLRKGVRYAEASDWEPYDRLAARAPEVRADIVRMLRTVGEEVDCYVLVNNHLEGHSPATIAEIQAELWGADAR